jgi:competence protein ComEA
MFKKLIFVIAITLASGLNSLTFAQSTADSAQLIDLNRASAEQLAEALDGVGIARARAIVQHRENYGEFDQVEELLMVSGIGDSIMEANRDRIIVE